MKDFAEQLNELKVDGYVITPMDKFAGTTTDITLKNHHTWGCPVYVLDEILQGNIAGLTKWEPRLREGMYLGHSPFHVGSVALVLNPSTFHVSLQLYLVFDDEFSTVSFMRGGSIPPNWTDIVQRISQSGSPDNIDLNYTWFAPDLEE